ncbi:nucleotidyl cyclase domain-containing protein [Lentisalinibacter salinarum]|uniref:hypothetical protein n=1 Tax=Lentisalinibacter salinarum TaxID=2992239 RepID=UPI0038705D8E
MFRMLLSSVILLAASVTWAEDQPATGTSDPSASASSTDDKIRESTLTTAGGFRYARQSVTVPLDGTAEQKQCSDVDVSVAPVDEREGYFRASMTVAEIESGKVISAPYVELLAGDEPAVLMVGTHAGQRVRLEVSLSPAADAASIGVTCFDGEAITMRYKTRVALSR